MATSVRHLLALFFLFLVLTACDSNPLDVDVSGVEIKLHTYRFDQEFFALDFQEPDTYQKLYQTYGDFAQDYTEYLLSYEPQSEGDRFALCQNFVQDAMMKRVYEAIQTVHNPRIDQYSAQLEDGFAHLKYHLPELEVPQVVYFHSGFYADTYVSSGILAIGLDYYLGPDHPIVEGLPGDVAPLYVRSKMRPDYVAVDAMGTFLADRYLAGFEGDRLLDNLIAQGKLMYLLDAAFPTLADCTKIRYTEQEMYWAQEAEANVWLELAHQEVMYNTNPVENRKWINDGPWTIAGQIPDTSPSRLGIYMGWQIVRAYMKDHPELGVRDLLAQGNHQLILNSYVPPS